MHRRGVPVELESFPIGSKISLQPSGSLDSQPIRVKTLCDWESSQTLHGQVVEIDIQENNFTLAIPTRSCFSAKLAKLVTLDLTALESDGAGSLVVGDHLQVVGTYTDTGFRCVLPYRLGPDKSKLESQNQTRSPKQK